MSINKTLCAAGLMNKRLKVQIPASPIQMFELSLGKTLNQKLLPMGLTEAAHW